MIEKLKEKKIGTWKITAQAIQKWDDLLYMKLIQCFNEYTILKLP